jgi:Skp family chaperone for outer membrane proteins
MKPTERIFVYSALTVLGAMNLVFLLSNSGRSAFAETRDFLADVLGPAESVKLLDGEKEVEIKAKGGRVTWGSGDFRQAYSVGFVDISRALNPLMEAPQFADERKTLADELDAKEKEYQERLDAFGKDIEGKDRNDPAVQETIKEAQAVYQEYLEWGRGAVERRNEIDVKQMQAAYKELTSAVDVVAQKLGVDIVLRFIPTEKEFTATDAEGALTEIRLRTAVKYPSGLDITSEVLEELDVEDAG